MLFQRLQNPVIKLVCAVDIKVQSLHNICGIRRGNVDYSIEIAQGAARKVILKSTMKI